MISIQNIQKKYAGVVALDIEELVIKRGEIIGLVGNNGAGKTTLLRLILDLIKADRGVIRSGIFNVAEDDSWKGYTLSFLDENFLLDFLTPEEFFSFVGNVYGFTKREIDVELSRYSLFLSNEILGKKKLIREYSTGNRQKIGIISTLICQPKVIILDEPFNGLDPTSQIVLKEILKNYQHSAEVTIIVSSHDLTHITDLSSRIVLIEKGKIIRDLSNNIDTLAQLTEYFAKPIRNIVE